ncbi:hypothetical protein K1T71_007006 [Dendrolimus kikuchii]|uniref:Uncharacterized protein n=1 Tax=Dendrolimus kikuchii TaxID=765133 RepID=A0ACC1D0F0_9NEOP|nr:hypothetical protein K1T71_007006 [Dendrolimus kikuchii]
MEKPDTDGFINVTWPSNRVPHGGIFHTRTTERTTDQQKFLKVLLEESRLSIAHRQKSAFQFRQEAERNIQKKTELPLVRPRTSRRRSLSAIRQSGIYEDDLYQPEKRGKDREKMKERLANVMAFGDISDQQIAAAPHKCNKTAEIPKLPTSKEKWNELLTQIRERAEWLAEMEYLGQASPHRDIINDQIAERMRALDVLGVDSECSTTRSTDSGFSTTRSYERGAKPPTVRIRSSASGSIREKKINVKSTLKHHKEENVTGYGKFTPLEYSPRRRV